MGIYVFKKDQLVKLLKETYIQSNDFGGEIIPAAAANHKTVCKIKDVFWLAWPWRYSQQLHLAVS